MNNCGVFATAKTDVYVTAGIFAFVIANGGVTPHPPQAVPLPLIIGEGFVWQSVLFWGITDYFGFRNNTQGAGIRWIPRQCRSTDRAGRRDRSLQPCLVRKCATVIFAYGELYCCAVILCCT